MNSQRPEPPQELAHSAQVFIGLGIGIIPLILAVIGVGMGINSLPLLMVALILYLGVLVAAIVCLCIARVRYIGYGLLAMVFVAPVVTFVACTVLLTRPS